MSSGLAVDINNTQGQEALGDLDLNGVADLMAQQRHADGALVGDQALEGICFVSAHDAVLGLLAGGHVHVLDGGAHGHVVGVDLALGDDHSVVDDGLQAGDLGLVLGLIVTGFGVFSVFGKVAEAAGDLDGLLLMLGIINGFLNYKSKRMS